MEREASHAVPHADLWATIEQRLTALPAPAGADMVQRDAGKAQTQTIRLRLASAAAAIIVLALALNVALPALHPLQAQPQGNSPAITMLPTPTFALDDSADLMPITMSLRAQPLHLSQTVSGYTVAHDRVY